MEIHHKGYQDYFFDKFDDYISVGRPTILAKNIVIGSLYIDIADQLSSINNKTQESCIVNFTTRGWSSNSYLKGSIRDKDGKERYTLHGSWLDEIYLKDESTGEKELLWKEKPHIQDYLKMFGFNMVAVNLNYISD